MMKVIAAAGYRAYLKGMADLWKLLVLIALVAMPFAMGGGAMATSHPMPTATAAMSHCDGSRSASDQKAAVGECAMSCAALAPADRFAVQPMAIICPPAAQPLTQIFTGIYPEIATPPPKRS